MAMATAAPFSLLLLLLLLPALTASAPPSEAAPYRPPTVADLLDTFRLPRGLLPPAARRYLLHKDGTFELFLDDSCGVVAGGYHIHYDVKISGKVEAGKVSALRGVYVRVLFVWLPITGVEVAGGEVTVSVGPLRRSFPAGGFAARPRCQSRVAAMADQ